jgi:hypothetical protein
MKRLWRSARISIGRATGFAAFGIACVMIPLSFNPRIMVRAGGLLTLGLAVGLILKANFAARQDYRRTEMWQTYLRFAMFAAGASVILWTMKVMLRLHAYLA